MPKSFAVIEMGVAQPPRVDLLCHSSTPTDLVRRLSATAHRNAHILSISFQLDAAMDCIRVPKPTAPRMTIGLWEHTCFEAFVTVPGSPAYRELNLSPSSEWAVFAFQSYREIAPFPENLTAPEITLHRGDNSLQLEATVNLDELSPAFEQAELHVGLSAVIEDVEGSLSYWALRHPAAYADFHHADARVLCIPGV
ncbi:MAG TPA: DOMON-like domain-containing protein [Candidatus Acidoferrales bacterium]|nr:DOMON-like domain-containing protein [Candidatus Acidoferrales bacterium]